MDKQIYELNFLGVKLSNSSISNMLSFINNLYFDEFKKEYEEFKCGLNPTFDYEEESRLMNKYFCKDFYITWQDSEDLLRLADVYGWFTSTLGYLVRLKLTFYAKFDWFLKRQKYDIGVIIQ